MLLIRTHSVGIHMYAVDYPTIHMYVQVCVFFFFTLRLNPIHFGFIFCRSYFAFNLASEHHKFYMKLRDSFISIQHISNELNIPLASIECATRSADIFPSDYELTNNGQVPADPNAPHEKTIIDSNIKIIDKATKANGMRVRNLKKSMLNDNKLLRLRDKLLRRSKSTVSLSVRPEHHTTNAPPSLDGDTKEEHQNKENEQPNRYNTIDYRAQMPPTPTKITSPNRNLVKMGTRVFSSQLLNKSYDNIFDSAGIDVYHFDDDFDDDRIVSASSTMAKHGRNNNKRSGKRTTTTAIVTDANEDGITDSSASGKKCMSNSTDAERLSLRSTSLSSLYFSEKMSERLCDSPALNEAYVIRK